MSDRVLRPGETCWRVESADRAALLVDGADYFAALHDSLGRARRSILIVGWDLDTRVELLRGGDDGPSSGRSPESPELPRRLEDLLLALLDRSPELEVRILIWDFSIALAHERQWPIHLLLGIRSHPRMRFRLDSHHPTGASHHQKVVVVDGRVAFAGGLDLSRCRWDTREHREDEPGRIDTGGRPYPPFHDTQMVVDGAAARALEELAADRWRRATGEEIDGAGGEEGPDPWPEPVRPGWTGVEIGIARTDPAHDGREEVREVESLAREAIASARRLIYIENQYLTSSIVSDALAARLEEEDGPEVVLVSSLATHGWLAEKLMDALRIRFLRKLREADRHGRLSVWYPAIPGDPGKTMTVHSKLMIVDRRLLRVGSSNVSNRSLCLDTECDLVLETDEGGPASEEIGSVLEGLLAEHLGRPREEVERALGREGSVQQVIEKLGEGERRLRPLDPDDGEGSDEWLPDACLIDPERPLDADLLVEHFVPRPPVEEKESADWGTWVRVGIVALALVLAAVWAWSPLSGSVDAATIASRAKGIASSPLAPLWVAAAFVAGSLVVFPITILVVATTWLFGPAVGTLYALAGSLLGGAVTYGAGALAGRDLVRRLAGKKLGDLIRKLRERGVLTVALVRVVPVAPFSIVNFVAGACRVRLRDFLGGTLLGMGPGILGIALMVDGMESAVLEPGPESFAWLLVLVAVVTGGGLLVRHWVRSRRRKG